MAFRALHSTLLRRTKARAPMLALFRWSFTTRGSLGERTARAAGWLITGDLVNQALGLVKMALLCRLIAPGDFGLMAFALIALKWVEYFSDTGIRTALIRHPGEVGSYLDTAWTLQV